MSLLKLEDKLTPDGKFYVRHSYIKGPYQIQQLHFDFFNLDFISPAQKALMSNDNSEENMFLKYSRTSMGILFLYEEKERKIALIKNGFSDNESIKNMLNAHRLGFEALIEKDKAYEIIDNAKKTNSALIFPAGIYTIPTHEFGNSEVPLFMFTNNLINANAQTYGYILKNIHRISEIVFDFEDSNSKPLEHGTYYNKILMRGPGGKFKVYGRGKPLSSDGGAIGVDFKKI